MPEKAITNRTGQSLSTVGAIVSLLISVGCGTIETVTDWNREADFSRYKTFQIDDGAGTFRSPSREPPERVIASVLESKGLRRVTIGPDLNVYVYVLKRAEARPAVGYGGWRDWAGAAACASTPRDADRESLGVDIVSAERKQAVWRGVACGSLALSDDSDQRVRRVATRLLQTFPPRPGEELNPLAWTPP